MNRFPLIVFPVLLSGTIVANSASAQNSTDRVRGSAPSSHLVFDDNFDGDIVINEVRVPKAGEALYTYYEALGWRGKAAGYAGIQAHPRGHNFIFSIWDHKDHTAPIRAVYRGPGTKTEGFGGEGTGLKSWNFKLGWSTDVWYTLVARRWPVGEHTYFGFWAKDGGTKVWTHLVTMDVAVAKAPFRGRTDAFIEDWLSTGLKSRTTHLRSGWKRKLDGSWFPFGSGRYSVNAWDLKPGKRSYNFRRHWNGGTSRDKTGAFYFMTAGGKNTKPQTSNPSRHAIKRSATRPKYDRAVMKSARIAGRSANKLRLEWKVDAKKTPPFSYQIQIHDTPTAMGKPILSTTENRPHARSTEVSTSLLKLKSRRYYVRLQCEDILGRPSKALVVPLNASSE